MYCGDLSACSGIYWAQNSLRNFRHSHKGIKTCEVGALGAQQPSLLASLYGHNSLSCMSALAAASLSKHSINMRAKLVFSPHVCEKAFHDLSRMSEVVAFAQPSFACFNFLSWICKQGLYLIKCKYARIWSLNWLKKQFTGENRATITLLLF